jgi:hypothetical protein
VGEARARLILGKVEYLKKEKGIMEEVINRQVRVDSGELGDWLVLQFLENRKYFELEKKQFADDCEATLLELEQRESSLSQDEATLKAHLDDATKHDAELTEKIERVTDVKNFQLICDEFDANLNQNNFLTQENHRLQSQHSTILSQLQTSQTSLQTLQTEFSKFTNHHKTTLKATHQAQTTQTAKISNKFQILLQKYKTVNLNLEKSKSETLQDAREIFSELQESLDVNRQVAEVINGIEKHLNKVDQENNGLKAEKINWGKEKRGFLADEQNSEIA